MAPDHQAAMSLVAHAVVIDLAANTLHLRVPGFPGAPGPGQPALLDVGSNGRLIGLEIGEWYVTVMDVPGEQDRYARAAGVYVDVRPGDPPSITLPRRGPGYEITYPSGNECWNARRVGGKLIQVCATIADAPSEPPAGGGH